MLNLSSLMIGTKDVARLAEFYKLVFEKKADMEDGGWYGWKVGNGFLTIGEHSEVADSAKEPQRLIINLETKDVKGEFERISKIQGVKVIKEPYTMEGPGGEAWIATLADPDGNYFQLMPPWEM